MPFPCTLCVDQLFIRAEAPTGRSGLSCMGCHLGCGRSAASGRGRCRTAFASALKSLLLTAGKEARARGTGNGGAGATRGGRSAASVRVWWAGPSGMEQARAWRLRLEVQTGRPGRTPAAAGRTVASLGVSEVEGWL